MTFKVGDFVEGNKPWGKIFGRIHEINHRKQTHLVVVERCDQSMTLGHRVSGASTVKNDPRFVIFAVVNLLASSGFYSNNGAQEHYSFNGSPVPGTQVQALPPPVKEEPKIEKKPEKIDWFAINKEIAGGGI